MGRRRQDFRCCRRLDDPRHIRADRRLWRDNGRTPADSGPAPGSAAEIGEPQQHLPAERLQFRRRVVAPNSGRMPAKVREMPGPAPAICAAAKNSGCSPPTNWCLATIFRTIWFSFRSCFLRRREIPAGSPNSALSSSARTPAPTLPASGAATPANLPHKSRTASNQPFNPWPPTSKLISRWRNIRRVG